MSWNSLSQIYWLASICRVEQHSRCPFSLDDSAVGCDVVIISLISCGGCHILQNNRNWNRRLFHLENKWYLSDFDRIFSVQPTRLLLQTRPQTRMQMTWTAYNHSPDPHFAHIESTTEDVPVQPSLWSITKHNPCSKGFLEKEKWGWVFVKSDADPWILAKCGLKSVSMTSRDELPITWEVTSSVVSWWIMRVNWAQVHVRSVGEEKRPYQRSFIALKVL